MQVVRGLALAGLTVAIAPAVGWFFAEPRVLSWKQRRDQPGERPPEPPETWLAHLKLQYNGHMFGNLDLGKLVHRGPMMSDMPELVDPLRHEMATHMERLAAG